MYIRYANYFQNNLLLQPEITFIASQECPLLFQSWFFVGFLRHLTRFLDEV